MSKRKKKNAITLVSLLLALVLLIGFYVWYSKDQAAKKAQDNSLTENTKGDTAAISLASMDTTLVNSIQYATKDTNLKLVLSDKVWKSETDPSRPINQSYVSNMLNLIKDVKAVRVVNDNPTDLTEYGLSQPSVIFNAAQSDNKTIKISIGSEAVGGQGYYAQVNNDPKVYLLDTTYGTGLAYNDTEMTEVESGPAISADTIFHIDVEKKDGNNFEVQYNQNNTADNSSNGLFPWVILKPYDVPYSADSTKLSDAAANFTSFQFISNVDYSGKDLAKYGLADPTASILVEYNEVSTQNLDKPVTDPTTGKQTTTKTIQTPKSIKIYIGNTDGAGNYYVMKDGSPSVFTINKDSVDKMLSVEPFSVLSNFVSIPNIDTIDSIDIQAAGKPYTMAITRETVKNDKGDNETKATYYYNGKTVDEAVFKDVYQVMISAGYDAQIKEPVNTTGVKPVLTITYHLNTGKTLSASYLPYNDSFDIVDTGNKINFFADKRKIDSIITSIQEFKGKDTTTAK